MEPLKPLRSPLRAIADPAGSAFFKAYCCVWLALAAALALIAFSLNGGGSATALAGAGSASALGTNPLWSDASGYALVHTPEGAPRPLQIATCAFQASLHGGVFYCTVSTAPANGDETAYPGVETEPCCEYTTSVQLSSWWVAWQATGCHDFAGSARCRAIIAMKDATQSFTAALTFALAALCVALLVLTEALAQMWRAPEAGIAALRVSKIAWALLLLPALVCTAYTVASYGPALLDFLLKFRDETALFDDIFGEGENALAITGVRTLRLAAPSLLLPRCLPARARALTRTPFSHALTHRERWAFARA